MLVSHWVNKARMQVHTTWLEVPHPEGRYCRHVHRDRYTGWGTICDLFFFFFSQSDPLPKQCHLWSFLLPAAFPGFSHWCAILQRHLSPLLEQGYRCIFWPTTTISTHLSWYRSIILLLTCSRFLLILEMWAELLFIKLLKIFLRALISLFKTYI